MELQLDRPGQYPYVHHVETDAIVVIHGDQMRRMQSSFILAKDRVIETWSVSSGRILTIEDMSGIVDLEPEVLLLGTGTRQIFPPADVMALLLRNHIGVEPMDNAAAARTHTVLTSEERNVVAAFMLPDGEQAD